MQNVLCLCNSLSKWLSKRGKFSCLPKIYSLLDFLIKDIQELKDLGASLCLITIIKSEYKKFRPEFKGILDLILKINPSSKQSSHFYEGYLYLIDEFFKKCEFTTHERKVKLSAKNFKEMQIKLYTA